MLLSFLYFLIALCSTTVGAMTGIGGGVIIKPVLDTFGQYDVATIGLLSSITVFAMALVSVAKQIQQKAAIRYQIALPLALGSVAGGTIGQAMLEALIAALSAGGQVKVVQNAILAVLIVLVFFYMLYKDKLPTLGLVGLLPSLLVGLILGVFSSFLGIGGGPINVALMIFVFSFDTKSAAVCSIITILFAQISKLLSVALLTGFSPFNLSMLPAMILGGVLGGFLGSKLNKRLPVKAVEHAFNGVQILVLTICVLNIIRNV